MKEKITEVEFVIGCTCYGQPIVFKRDEEKEDNHE